MRNVNNFLRDSRCVGFEDEEKNYKAAESLANYGDASNRTPVSTSDSARPTQSKKSDALDALAERIVETIGNEAVAAFSRRCGVPESNLRSYINDGRTPPVDNAARIANAGGVLVEWLATGKLPKTHAEQMRMKLSEAADGYVSVALYNDARAAAGAGAVVETEIADDALMFKEDWIRQELGTRSKDLYLIRVAGDSMEPTLRSGDVILVDRRTTTPDREGIYIMRMGDMLLVKRLQVLPGRRVRMTSDNANFAPCELALSDLNGGEVVVIGRVVWSGHRL